MKDNTRICDVIISSVALIILSPFFLIIAILITLNSKGPVLFRQTRVGQNNKDFILYKFRTMTVNAHESGRLTVGSRDRRITWTGYRLRKYKIDEFPQLLNVLKGEMSIVGPRPELRYYVNMYSEEQKKVLTVKPGITDYASIEYRNENDMLEKAENPEEFYIKNIMPIKIRLNYAYIANKQIRLYFYIIFMTLFALRRK